MKIDLEVSNSFQLELESGANYSIREDGFGRLAIMSRDKDNVVVFTRQGADQAPKRVGEYHEIIVV